jgi:Tfp pilus assembly protein PilF
MTRWGPSLMLAIALATAASAAEPPQEPRTQEAVQRYNAGVGALARRDLEHALYQFRQAIRLNPNLVEAHQNLGITLLELRQPGEAAEAFAKALELQPDNLEARLGLGLAFRAQGDNSRAIAEL